MAGVRVGERARGYVVNGVEECGVAIVGGVAEEMAIQARYEFGCAR